MSSLHHYCGTGGAPSVYINSLHSLGLKSIILGWQAFLLGGPGGGSRDVRKMLLGTAILKGEVSLTRKEVEAAKDPLEIVRTVKSKHLYVSAAPDPCWRKGATKPSSSAPSGLGDKLWKSACRKG